MLRYHYRTCSFALLLIAGACPAQEQRAEESPRAETPHFSVDHPQGDGWTVTIDRHPSHRAEHHPFTDDEQIINFEREFGSPEGSGPSYLISAGIGRTWPRAEACDFRGDGSTENLLLPEPLYEDERFLEFGFYYIRNLERCGSNADGYGQLRILEAEFTAQEMAAMSGATYLETLSEGIRVDGDRNIYFGRFRFFTPPGRFARWDIATYVLFPPDFGEPDLYFYEMMIFAVCNYSSSCNELDAQIESVVTAFGSLETSP